jgi:hypothetical protein
MGSAIQSQTSLRPRKAVAADGFSGSWFDRSSAHSAPSSRHQRAGQLVTGGCRQTATRVIVAHASRAISLFNPDRNHAAVRSPEARRDRHYRSPATIRESAVLQVRRQGFQPGDILGLQVHEHGDGVVPAPARLRWSAGRVRITGVPAARGGELGVRRPSWVYHPSIDGEGVPLRSVYVTKRRLGGDRIGG